MVHAEDLPGGVGGFSFNIAPLGRVSECLEVTRGHLDPGSAVRERAEWGEGRSVPLVSVRRPLGGTALPRSAPVSATCASLLGGRPRATGATWCRLVPPVLPGAACARPRGLSMLVGNNGDDLDRVGQPAAHVPSPGGQAELPGATGGEGDPPRIGTTSAHGPGTSGQSGASRIPGRGAASLAEAPGDPQSHVSPE